MTNSTNVRRMFTDGYYFLSCLHVKGKVLLMETEKKQDFPILLYMKLLMKANIFL